jgi:hypothetical protein
VSDEDTIPTRVQFWLEHLDHFVAAHGHAAVPQHFEDESGRRLGAWVKQTRAKFWANRLDPATIAALEGRPGWLWRASKRNRALTAEGRIAPSEDPLAFLSALTAFAERHGHTFVPAHGATPAVPALGQWVRSQRAHHGAGDLSAPRIALLEAVPHWTWENRSASRRWEETYGVLRQWAAEHGTATMPRTAKTASGQPIGAWVSTQRRAFREQRLSSDRIEKLQALPGWHWSAPTAQDVFADRSAELEALDVATGTGRPLPRHLRRWVDRRVVEYKRGLLSDDRLAALNAQRWWRWMPRSRAGQAFREEQEALHSWLESYR